MRRRRILTAASGLAGLPGCLDAFGSRGSGAGRTATATPVTAVDGVELRVDAGEIRTPLHEDAIQAITEPAFGDDWADWSAMPAEHRPDEPPALGGAAPVVGVALGAARAYPLAILNWHEVVTDAFGGPLLVTSWPVCGSAVVAERAVRGEATTFGVSGRLWRGTSWCTTS